jgi:hypothetical protein
VHASTWTFPHFLSRQDLEAALRKTPPSVAAAELPRFRDWHATFASV